MGTTTSTTQGAPTPSSVSRTLEGSCQSCSRDMSTRKIHHAHKRESGYQRTPVDIHEGYLDMPSAPHYGALELERENVDVGGEARASLAVTNTGGRHGTAVSSSMTPTLAPE